MDAGNLATSFLSLPPFSLGLSPSDDHTHSAVFHLLLLFCLAHNDPPPVWGRESSLRGRTADKMINRSLVSPEHLITT